MRVSNHGRRLGIRSIIIAISSAFLFVTTTLTALAVHELKFQLDGNTDPAAYPGGSISAQPYDWQTFFDASGPGGDIAQIGGGVPSGPQAAGFVATGATADYDLPDFSTYATGSKDTLNIGPTGVQAAGWQCSKSNNVGDKVDIVNAYSAAFRNPADNHLILYFGVEKSSPNGDSNIAVWFLHDKDVGCSSTGRAVDFSGDHRNGDILLVSAFTNGGTQANVAAYEWVGGADGSLNTTPIATGNVCGATPHANTCAITNATGSISPPWNHRDKDGGALNSLEFFEGGVDITAALPGLTGAEQCFARFLANTRSSQSLTATLFDFAAGSLPVCGELRVHKYIDVNANGSKNGGDIDGSGWSFVVKGPKVSTIDLGPTICTGTTGSDGFLVCGSSDPGLTNLVPGDYTITETQTTGFYNTDPGSGDVTAPIDLVNTSASVTKTVPLSVSGITTVEFGNTCFIAKTFQINGVPTGATAPDSITVSYTVTSGHNTDTNTTLSLAPKVGDATKWVGTVNGHFVQTDTIDWSWYVNGDSAHTALGQTGELLSDQSGGTYPGCAVTNNTNFPNATLNGFKYKDMNADGDLNGSPPEPGLGSFQFTLKKGSTVIATTTSASDGSYSFSNVPPGNYTVVETAKTGWLQTEPPSGGQSVAVNLGDTSVTIGDFGNTPLSDIDVTFTPLTDPRATNATIVCKDAGDNTVGSQSDDSYAANDLIIGTYTCTVVITDP